MGKHRLNKERRVGFVRLTPITGLVIFCRLMGWLQPLEWRALDATLRWRPAETTDPYITIVFITEEDIRESVDHPPSDQDLSELIETIQTYQPRVVGIDIFRDEAVGAGTEALKETLLSHENVVMANAIGKVGGVSIDALDYVPDEQIGFVDAVVDSDGAIRVSQLAETNLENCTSSDCYKMSFTIQVADKYLARDGFPLETGHKDPNIMRFGALEIPDFKANTGGYVRADSGGHQTLINFRAGAEPFTQMTYSEVVSDSFPSATKQALLQDKIVLVAYNAESLKDVATSFAINAENPGLIPAALIQGHAISQILNGVYHHRPLLKSLPDFVEYGLIFLSGCLGILLVRRKRSLSLYWLVMVSILGCIILAGYYLLQIGWWLPIVPTTTALGLNAVALFPLIQAQKQLQIQEQKQVEVQRETTQRVITQAYSAIHNGPLQEFVSLLRAWPTGQSLPAENKERLRHGYEGVRNIYRDLKAEMIEPDSAVMFSQGEAIASDLPIHEMLQTIYRLKKQQYRDLFSNLAQITKFEAMADSHLSQSDRQLVVRFFEEALNNVYKHAKDATRIKVSCRTEGDRNIIQVIDNGSGLSLAPIETEDKGGFGTTSAQHTAHQLGGNFRLFAVEPQGMCCELSWPTVRATWRSKLPGFNTFTSWRNRTERK